MSLIQRWEGFKMQVMKRGQDQGPPNLDALLADWMKRLQGQSGKPQQPVTGLGWLLLPLVLIVFALGFVVVKPSQEAAVLRLGQYHRTLKPGLHWVPVGIESVHRVDVQRLGNFSYADEMLTRDENIVRVTASVVYRIIDPRAFLFNAARPINSLQQATASAVRQVVGRTTLDQVLTQGRQAVRDAVEKQLTRTLSLYGMGIEVVDVNLQSAKPPEEVTEAFDDAIKAREDEQRYIKQASAYAQKVAGQAKGQVSRLLTEAKAYEKQVLLMAQARVAYYLALLKSHQAHPDVTDWRLYTTTLGDVLSRVSKVYVAPKHPVTLMPLDKLFARSPDALDSDTGTDDLPTTKDTVSVPAVKTAVETPASKPEVNSQPLARRSYDWAVRPETGEAR